MEKEQTIDQAEKKLFENLVATKGDMNLLESNPLYEELLSYNFYENLLFDPSNELPRNFNCVKEYIEYLGEGPLAILQKQSTLEVLYPAGQVIYCTHSETNTLLIEKIILYAVTAEPGVRAIGTKKFDKHLLFELEEPASFELTAEHSEISFPVGDNAIMRVSLQEPEDSNIKDWWSK